VARASEEEVDSTKVVTVIIKDHLIKMEVVVKVVTQTTKP